MAGGKVLGYVKVARRIEVVTRHSAGTELAAETEAEAEAEAEVKLTEPTAVVDESKSTFSDGVRKLSKLKEAGCVGCISIESF